MLHVSDKQKFFKYFSSYEIGYNSPEPLSDERIYPIDQVVNANSSETSNLDNITNEVPQRMVIIQIKTNNMKMSVLYH